MDFEKFKEQFTEDVKKTLNENGGEGIKFDLNKVNKPNESYDAMTVTPEGSHIGVNMNINQFFTDYENGVDYNAIVQRAADIIEKGIDQTPGVDVTELMDYSKMKEKLAMEVISSETNTELLSRIPHHNIEDMAVVYRFVLDSQDDGQATVLVTNNLMEQYGITQDQLHADAMVNAPEIKPAVIQGMSEVITEMMGPDAAMLGIEMPSADELMYVASTPDKVHGACVISYQDFMDQAAEKLGGDFFILPSSIHEILLVRDDGSANYHDLKNMVQEVNATQVSPEEKLTDNVYHYDSKAHVFELAEKFEARKERESEVGEMSEEKGSVIKNLKDKQKEIGTQSVKDVAEKVNKVRGGEAL